MLSAAADRSRQTYWLQNNNCVWGVNMQQPYLLWIGPVVDEATMHQWVAVSPAANRWQTEMISALQTAGVPVVALGHLPEPVWPKGRWRIAPEQGRLPSDVSGRLVGYKNLPRWRDRDLIHNYRQAFDHLSVEYGRPAVVMSYNASPVTVSIASYIRQQCNAPWVSIMADADASPSADGWVFLSWGYYTRWPHAPKLHLDGGTELKCHDVTDCDAETVDYPVALYAGTMTKYGGVDLLVRAFSAVKAQRAELWICGKGSNATVERAVATNSAVKFFGFVSEERLAIMGRQATLFVNPRPSMVPGNEKNFPSKILDYLSYGKPVVSSWTDGLSPAYRDVLVVPEEESPSGFAKAINDVLFWSPERRETMRQRIDYFVTHQKRWLAQVKRLLHWLHENDLMMGI